MITATHVISALGGVHVAAKGRHVSAKDFPKGGLYIGPEGTFIAGPDYVVHADDLTLQGKFGSAKKLPWKPNARDGKAEFTMMKLDQAKKRVIYASVSLEEAVDISADAYRALGMPFMVRVPRDRKVAYIGKYGTSAKVLTVKNKTDDLYFETKPARPLEEIYVLTDHDYDNLPDSEQGLADELYEWTLHTYEYSFTGEALESDMLGNYDPELEDEDESDGAEASLASALDEISYVDYAKVDFDTIKLSGKDSAQSGYVDHIFTVKRSDGREFHPEEIDFVKKHKRIVGGGFSSASAGT